MTTARELVSDALNDIGVLDVNETMTAEQAQHGLRTINRIVDRWNARRLQIFAISQVVATFSGATASIGPGLTIDTPSPLRLLPGGYYVKSGLSYQLPVWDRESYNAVILKSLSGEYPSGIYYDRQIPGTVYVWPVPSAPLEYHLQVMQQLSEFADLDTDYTFPAGYKDAFFYSLCERLPPAYNLPVGALAAAEAKKARDTIAKNNTEVPLLDTVDDGGRFNIFSNQFQ